MKRKALFATERMQKTICMGAILGLATAACAAEPKLDDAGLLHEVYGQLPVLFIPNQGQVDEQVAFVVQGRDKTIFFTEKGLTFLLSADGTELGGLPSALDGTDDTGRWVVQLEFLGARQGVRPESLETADTLVSYFLGESEDWKSGMVASSRIMYRNLWPGIDLVYYGTVNRLKYDFIVHAGADPAAIRLAYRGAESLRLTDEGRLEIATPLSLLHDDVPVAWQEDTDVRTDVAVRYVLESEGPTLSGETADGETGKVLAYGFEVGEYDRDSILIIDPVMLVYSGLLGSNQNDWGLDIAVDARGCAYVIGTTHGDGLFFPLTPGPFGELVRYYDVFVTKLNSKGSAVEYTAILGGSSHDSGRAIAVDGAGNAYIAGSVPNKTNFPLLVGPSLVHNGGGDPGDAFVAKLNATGTALFYSGFIGGRGNDDITSIAIDTQGHAYVTGWTISDNFPITGGWPYTTYGGNTDAFVAKVKPDGSGLVYSGYLGGNGRTWGNAIAVDSQGRAYVTGFTAATNFPRVGTSQPLAGGEDIFVVRVRATGSGLEYTHLLGGADNDAGRDIAVDADGAAYITGYWGLQAFLTKILPTGTIVSSFGGLMGGSQEDRGQAIAVDRKGFIYVAGDTRSPDFPVFNTPTTYRGGRDAFIVMLDPTGKEYLYSGYLGGTDDDVATGVALDRFDDLYVVGYTRSVDFPVTEGFTSPHRGADDAFVAKISLRQRSSAGGALGALLLED